MEGMDIRSSRLPPSTASMDLLARVCARAHQSCVGALEAGYLKTKTCVKLYLHTAGRACGQHRDLVCDDTLQVC